MQVARHVGSYHQAMSVPYKFIWAFGLHSVPSSRSYLHHMLNFLIIAMTMYKITIQIVRIA